jgi:hypothetical protein
MAIDRETLRLQCLSMAVFSAGADVEFEYVVDAARAYEGFVVGRKPELRVVSNDDSGA